MPRTPREPAADFELRDARPGDERAVQGIVAAVLAEYGLAPGSADTDADIADLRRNYQDRGGVFRIVTDGTGTICGCGGLFPLGAEEMELRKMYLLPAARGRGLGRRLLEELLAAARTRGCRRVVLETASVLKQAQALYRSAGFVPAERAHLADRCDRFMALELAGDGRS